MTDPTNIRFRASTVLRRIRLILGSAGGSDLLDTELQAINTDLASESAGYVLVLPGAGATSREIGAQEDLLPPDYPHVRIVHMPDEENTPTAMGNIGVSTMRLGVFVFLHTKDVTPDSGGGGGGSTTLEEALVMGTLDWVEAVSRVLTTPENLLGKNNVYQMIVAQSGTLLYDVDEKEKAVACRGGLLLTVLQRKRF
jgi:hypothetical protein